MNAPKRWEIRFSSGLLAGQNLVLPSGETRVGSDERSDIFVPSREGSGVAICLSPDSAGLHVRFEGGRGKVGGRRIARSIILTREARITLGALDLYASPEQRADAIGAKAGARAGSPFVRFDLAIIGCSVLALAASAASAVGIPAPGAQESSASYVHELIAISKRAPGLENTSFTTRDGKILIGGRCRDGSALSQIVSQFINAGQVVEDSAVCDDDLVRSVQSILRSAGLESMSVTSGSQAGTVVVHGATSDLQGWHDIGLRLNSVRGLTGWSLRDDVGQYLKPFIAELATEKLVDKLTVVRKGAWIDISGILSGADQSRLEVMIAALRRDSGGTLKISFENSASHASPDQYFPSPIVSMGGARGIGYLELADGTRLQVLSSLPNGFRISSISADGIELTRADALVHIPLGF